MSGVDSDRAAQGEWTARVAFLLAAVVFLFVLRDAWVSDDAYITGRTIEQWYAGNGLGFNPGERVQAYTHPLWMFLYAGMRGLTGELFFSSILLSLAFTALGLHLLFRLGRRLRNGTLVALVAIACSRFFVDFSTSGLENPLINVLLALFVGSYLKVVQRARPASRGDVLALALLSSLIGTTRVDALVLITPAWAYLLGGALWRREPLRVWWVGLLLGALPFLAWELFSLVYYGSFVPNTALAKLNTGLPRGEMIQQGLVYLRETARRDYVLGALLLLAPAWVWLWKLPRRTWPLWLGALLSCAYVVSVGGDFMAGRFWIAPSFMLLLLITQSELANRVAVVAASVFVLLGAATPGGVLELREPISNAKMDPSGVVREWQYHAPHQALALWNRGRRFPRPQGDARAFERDEVVPFGKIGVISTQADPSVYLVDIWALVDPLLARLPASHVEASRVGHYTRTLPPGYLETLREGQNRFVDPKLGEFYGHVKRIVSGPIWSKQRWRSIWKLQTGALEGLLDRDAIAFASATETLPFIGERNVQELSTKGAGVWVDVKRAKRDHHEVLAAVLGAKGRYRLTLIRNGRVVHHVEFGPFPGDERLGRVQLVFVPPEVARLGYERVRVFSLDDAGGTLYALGSTAKARDQAKLSAALHAQQWIAPPVVAPPVVAPPASKQEPAPEVAE
ncbi:MAG TPA: hypothetical protein VLC09_01100 [Polyangiaceae bacterium]|nr:hypothetical protein [Polyangiaceae bacterium]